MQSLGKRIQIAVVSVTLVVVATIVLLVNDAVVRILVNKENARAQETLDLALMTIRNENSNYTFHREALLEERRQALKSIIDSALAAVAHAHSLSENGTMTEEESQRLALESVRGMRYAGGSGYIWIQDCTPSTPRMLMHPTIPEIEGGNPQDPRYFEALGGETNLLAEFVERTKEGGAFVAYNWPKPTPEGLTDMQPKISFVTRFKPWSWLVGTGLYIDDIERTCNQHHETMVQSAMDLLAEVRLMESGYLYVFDSDGVLLLHPRVPTGKSAMHLINPASGNPLLPETMAAARSPEGRLEYRWNKPGQPADKLFDKVAYVRYFEPFDWYIASGIYKDELYAPARSLSVRILGVSAALLVLAIALSAKLVRSIVHPLTRLADSARRMHAEGIQNMDLAELQVRGPHEVEALAQGLHQLVHSLRRQQQQLTATLDSIGDAVIATDADGCITRANPVAETLTGWSADEMIGRPLSEVFDIIHTQTREPMANPVKRVMRSGEVVQIEERAMLRTRDGRELHIDDSAAPIRTDQGEIVGVVLVFRDITQKLAIEERFRQGQKMEAIGQLAGGVAHDFNNMLGGILGAVDLLEDCVPPGDATAHQLTGLINESARRCANLAAQLLAFSRKQSFASKCMSLHDVLSDTIDLLRHSVDKRITLEADLGAEACNVIGDAAQLQSVFLNLGINAVHAMPDGGTLTFESKVTHLDRPYCDASEFDLAPGPYIDVAVRDTGHGISTAHLKKIFEPFFTTKPPGQGTGLGLSACYGTILQHKGLIIPYSEEGKGTTFHVALPLTRVEMKRASSSHPLRKGDGTILLVEDEAAIRIAGEGILRKWGYRVLVAENGREAIDLYRRHRDTIDLVVCDMIMPEMNGRDCFFALKHLNPHVRFILASGLTRREDTAEMSEHGLAGYIRKPFSAAELVQAVQDVLDPDQAESPRLVCSSTKM